MDIINRNKEKKLLKEIYSSKQAEFLVVYGRRRVGKTYLIKNYFLNLNKKSLLFFHITGINNATRNIQLERFTSILSDIFYKGVKLEIPKNWMQAFNMLTEAMQNDEQHTKFILFFDELPWLATKKSGIISAMEYFWNRHWVDNPKIKLIVCGSSASWMINKIINNRGGLHNRITKKINLMPLDIKGVQELLTYQGCKYTKQQLLKIYLAFGGIPYYLKQIKAEQSADENINNLLFSQDSILFDEFDNVFSSLFEDSSAYREIVLILSKTQKGILQQELTNKIKLSSKGGRLTNKLNNLEASGFISSDIIPGHKRKGIYYRLSDEYCYFYLKWVHKIKNKLKKEQQTTYWLDMINSPSYKSWSGYAFENFCYKHMDKIKQALNIPYSILGETLHYLDKKRGTQIDLLFRKTDHTATLCEIKYTSTPYILTKADYNNLINKCKLFNQENKIEQQVFLALISANGVKENKYIKSNNIKIVTLSDFFFKST